MNIKPFKVEEWMNAYETGARYNIAETCVDSISLDELWALSGVDKQAFWEEVCARRMTYGYIEGHPDFLRGICSLYRTVKPENIVTTHGAAGANHHVFYSLVEPGDRVVSVMPSIIPVRSTSTSTERLPFHQSRASSPVLPGFLPSQRLVRY